MYLPHWPIPDTIGKRQIDFETVFSRAGRVLENLGNPHLALPPIIHITGTNGKGSVASTLAKILNSAGFSASLYTSPHLHYCNERIKIAKNGDLMPIEDGYLYYLAEKTRLASNNIPLTFFEAFSIMAFIAFAENKSDIVVMEVGMGGRIDITNIIDNKIATIITPISLDHVEYLGDNVGKIALEKALIARKDVPLVVGPQPELAEEIIKIIAKDRNAPALFYNQDFTATKINQTENGFEILELKKDLSLSFDPDFAVEFLKPLDNGNDFCVFLPKPKLIGDHQYINSAIAVATIKAISDKFPIHNNVIAKAIANVEWQGRLERHPFLVRKFLGNNSHSEIWFDGAHNIDGAIALKNWLIEEQKYKKCQNFIIFGCSRGKFKPEFLENFTEIANLIAIRVNGEPYPEDPEKIIEIATIKTGSKNTKISLCSNLENALTTVNGNHDNAEIRIIICGSLHLARDIKLLYSNN